MSTNNHTPVEAVRKSSLATNEKKRKTSFVSFKEEDTTIEFSEESVSDVNQSEVETKDEELKQTRFSKFNDSMKINKRRMSRDEQRAPTGK